MPETILPDDDREHQWYATAAGRRAVERVPWRRNPDLHALGRAMLELRARRGLSQEELGAVSALHRNYVGALERGEINPTFRVLLKLVTGLRLPLSELIDVYARQREPLDPDLPHLTARTNDR
jgi:DNA-binding XRE family transcriptional regulator